MRPLTYFIGGTTGQLLADELGDYCQNIRVMLQNVKACLKDDPEAAEEFAVDVATRRDLYGYEMRSCAALCLALRNDTGSHDRFFEVLKEYC